MSVADFPNQHSAEGYAWRAIFHLGLHHRHELAVAQGVAILAAVASVPLPMLMPLLVDEVLLGKPGPATAAMDRLFPQDWHGPILYILAMLALSLLLRVTSVLLQVLQARQFTIVAKDITLRLRKQVLGHLTRVSMSEYETLGSGAVSSHLVTDVETIDRFIGVSLSKLVVAILSVIGTALVLLWIHWKLALFILLMNPFVIYLTMALGRRVKQLKRRENHAFEVFQQALTETLDAMQQVRASNREGWFFARLLDKAVAVKEHAVASEWKSDAANRLSFVVFLFGFDIFRAISMLMVVFSDLSIGLMMAVFGYLWYMMSPVQEILNIQYAYANADAALGRLNNLLRLRREPEYPPRTNPFLRKTSVAVTLEDVTFTYGDGPTVLDRVSLHIRAGERVALVGASGGGKSTLTQVVVGLYAPSSGVVRFDGVPVSHIGLDVVRQHVATVLQTPALFNDTVRMNLTLGAELPEERLWRALEISQLGDLVKEMKDGLDTVVGRQGVRLSGGQRQRLAIARMVLTQPKVVILDEATSNLDTATEAALHDALREFLAGRTTLIIAHRLSAVRQADRVYVFDGGRIVEEGIHEHLVQKGGLYAQLYGKAQE